MAIRSPSFVPRSSSFVPRGAIHAGGSSQGRDSRYADTHTTRRGRSPLRVVLVFCCYAQIVSTAYRGMFSSAVTSVSPSACA